MGGFHLPAWLQPFMQRERVSHRPSPPDAGDPADQGTELGLEMRLASQEAAPASAPALPPRRRELATSGFGELAD